MTDSTRKMINDKITELANIIVPIDIGVRRIGNVNKRWHLEAIAKHVLASELRARIDSLTWYLGYDSNVPIIVHGDTVKKINEITEQLKEIEEYER